MSQSAAPAAELKQMKLEDSKVADMQPSPTQMYTQTGDVQEASGPKAAVNAYIQTETVTHAAEGESTDKSQKAEQAAKLEDRRHQRHGKHVKTHKHYLHLLGTLN